VDLTKVYEWVEKLKRELTSVAADERFVLSCEVVYKGIDKCIRDNRRINIHHTASACIIHHKLEFDRICNIPVPKQLTEVANNCFNNPSNTHQYYTPYHYLHQLY
jgi:hypothetical protein